MTMWQCGNEVDVFLQTKGATMTSNGNVGRRRRKRDLNSTDIASEWLWKKKKKQEKRTLSSLSTLSRPHWSSSRFKGCRVLACHDHATNNSFVLCTNNPCIFVNCGIFLQNIQIRYFWSNKLKFAPGANFFWYFQVLSRWQCCWILSL